jgi:hypothetical protein
VTWSRLQEEHSLASMLGIAPDALLPMAARQLGIKTEVKTLLAACVGGNLGPRSPQ